MENYATLSRDLTELLQLEEAPVAVSFTSQAPEGVARFSGQAPAGCRFWQDARDTAFTTVTSDHELCAIGVHTHNLQPSPMQQKDLMDALQVFADLGYVRAEDIPQIPVLNRSAAYVTYAPLSETPVEPDVVVLFVRADQTLILSEATQQMEGDHAPAMGRPACAVVPQVVNSGRPALSLGCCGARAYLDSFTEEKSIFALPGSKLESYVDRIRTLVNANAVLRRFHLLRAREVAEGKRPSIQDSLTGLRAGA